MRTKSEIESEALKLPTCTKHKISGKKYYGVQNRKQAVTLAHCSGMQNGKQAMTQACCSGAWHGTMRGKYYVKVAVGQQITIYVKLAADSFEQLASQQLNVIWLLQNSTLPAHRWKILWAFATAKYCNTVSSSTAVTVFLVVLLMQILEVTCSKLLHSWHICHEPANCCMAKCWDLSKPSWPDYFTILCIVTQNKKVT